MTATNPPSSLPHTLSLLSLLNPPSLSRTWLSAPHPSLPLIATCSSDRSVRIYSLTSFTLLSTISGGHKRSVRTCAWKPNLKGESVLATGSFDSSVGIWRRWDGYGAEAEKEGLGFGAMGRDIGDGENSDGSDDEEWKFAIVLDGHDSEVKSVAYSPSGNLLATSSRDKSIWVWEELPDGDDDGDVNYETIAVLQDHEGDVKCVAWHPTEELFASSSYDDTIRLWKEVDNDWESVCVLRGHEGTVWMVDWEDPKIPPPPEISSHPDLLKKYNSRKESSGPRLLSCSDDLSIRIWHRKPSASNTQDPNPFAGGHFPSIIRTSSPEETWVQEAELPRAHERNIYAVAWSKRTGRIVSTGSDGRIVVYEEGMKDTTVQDSEQTDSHKPQKHTNGDETENNNGISSKSPNPASPMEDIQPEPEPTEPSPDPDPELDSESSIPTSWHIIAQIEAAHDVFEVNHVCWARRADRGKRTENEEVIVSTGDDGTVKVWVLD
ncbi:MAG: Cytosolic iron-sulfur protein assembly protein [Cirrosporium novae-zelandiae]|nr:MAG: Cytosolic iron-sulfur protein assembly protein [Cirrosporium novae-zelandiae]